MNVSLHQLRSRRRRPLLAWISFGILACASLGAWVYLLADAADWFGPRRLANLSRFLGEARPWPVQQGKAWGSLGGWAKELWLEQGARGLWTTLLIAVASAALAGVLAFVSVPLTSRLLAVPEPFSDRRGSGFGARLFWGILRVGTRLVFMLARSLPEMILTFILIAIFGFGPWAAVLALALHYAGVLGRLSSELVEHADHEAPAALRMQGAGRKQIYLFAIFPEILNRFLVFFFYRWETCVREATVLGLLGIVSLGHFIEEARVRFRYDEMLFLILLGALLVIAGDFVSSWLRRRIEPPVETW